MDILHVIGRGLLGVVIILGIAVLLSKDRAHIRKRFVISGLGFIVLFAVLLLKVPFITAMIEGVSLFFIKMVDFSDKGASIIFGDLVDTSSYGFIFAFHVLPNIIFFSAISSVLYYFGVLQFLVKKFAWVLTRAFHLSGAECAAAAANVFLGQISASIMIKPYLPRMSRAEMFCVMTGGMATISGSVMLGIIGIMGGENPEMKLEFAKYLLIASILSAPAALLISHIIMPKTGPVDENVDVSSDDMGVNLFDALAQGTGEGLRVALSIGSILIVFTGGIALLNWVCVDGIGSWTGLNAWIVNISGGAHEGLTLQAIFGAIFAPFAWIVGVDNADLFVVGNLLGQKVVLNEIVGYIGFADVIKEGMLSSPHSIMVTTLAMCSFANLTSIGVQISGFSALASNQRVTVSQLALLAVVSGNLACFLSATIAGVILS